MIKIIFCIVIVIIFLLSCLLSFLAGCIVFKLQSEKSKEFISSDPKEEEKKRKAKKEYENFMSYTGDEQ